MIFQIIARYFKLFDYYAILDKCFLIASSATEALYLVSAIHLVSFY